MFCLGVNALEYLINSRDFLRCIRIGACCIGAILAVSILRSSHRREEVDVKPRRKKTSETDAFVTSQVVVVCSSAAWPSELLVLLRACGQLLQERCHTLCLLPGGFQVTCINRN